MSKANQNIDETFRNAFQDWEADYSMQEMNADWDAFSRNIPQPQQPQAPQKPMVKSPLTNPWSAAKILGLSSAAGIIITAATLLFNNSDSNENNKLSQKSVETNNLPKTEQVNNEKSINTTSESIISQDLKENGNNKEVAAHKNEINNSGNTSSAQSLANTTSANNIAKENISLFEGNNNNIIQPKQDKNNNIANKEITIRNIELNDTSICQSAAIRIYNSNNDRNSEMRISWGDGKMIKTNQAIAIYAYETPGTYELKVEYSNEVITRKVTVFAKPVAHFTNNQSNGLTCKFRNTSENANGYMWFFGDDRQPQSGYNAEYTFPDTGRYPVKLVAFNRNRCTDTLVQLIKVSNRNKFSIINVFTPNNDGSNDVFEVNIENPEYYELTIMDKAGEVVFRSQDIRNSWNGISQVDGRPCRGGVYLYSIRYRSAGENINQLSGILTLIR